MIKIGFEIALRMCYRTIWIIRIGQKKGDLNLADKNHKAHAKFYDSYKKN